jgi:hypothetical protein
MVALEIWLFKRTAAKLALRQPIFPKKKNENKYAGDSAQIATGMMLAGEGRTAHLARTPKYQRNVRVQ